MTVQMQQGDILSKSQMPLSHIEFLTATNDTFQTKCRRIHSNFKNRHSLQSNSLTFIPISDESELVTHCQWVTHARTLPLPLLVTYSIGHWLVATEDRGYSLAIFIFNWQLIDSKFSHLQRIVSKVVFFLFYALVYFARARVCVGAHLILNARRKKQTVGQINWTLCKMFRLCCLKFYQKNSVSSLEHIQTLDRCDKYDWQQPKGEKKHLVCPFVFHVS